MKSSNNKNNTNHYLHNNADLAELNDKQGDITVMLHRGLGSDLRVECDILDSTTMATIHDRGKYVCLLELTNSHYGI